MCLIALFPAVNAKLTYVPASESAVKFCSACDTWSGSSPHCVKWQDVCKHWCEKHFVGHKKGRGHVYACWLETLWYLWWVILQKINKLRSCYRFYHKYLCLYCIHSVCCLYFIWWFCILKCFRLLLGHTFTLYYIFLLTHIVFC